VKPLLVAGAALAVVVGAVLAYLSGPSATGTNIHLAGLVVMVAGLLVLASVLVQALIGLRRTGKHRRSGLAANADDDATATVLAPPPGPVPNPNASANRPNSPVRTRNPQPAVQQDRASGRRHTDNFRSGPPPTVYEGSHASRIHDEPAARRDTPAGW
jgi:hypothetical protein